MRGGVPAQFFCHLFISAFLVNKRCPFPPPKEEQFFFVRPSLSWAIHCTPRYTKVGTLDVSHTAHHGQTLCTSLKHWVTEVLCSNDGGLWQGWSEISHLLQSKVDPSQVSQPTCCNQKHVSWGTWLWWSHCNSDITLLNFRENARPSFCKTCIVQRALCKDLFDHAY